MQPSQPPLWKARAKKRGRERLARDARRVGIVVALVALVVGFSFLLFPPFFAPKAHLFLAGAVPEKVLTFPALPYVAEELASMGSIEDVNSSDCSDYWGSKQQAEQIFEKIAEADVSSRDTLVFYVNAHGITENGVGYLLCNNFDLRQPDTGRIAVDDLIAQLRSTRARTKLLVINAGRIDYDPALGVIGNRFCHALEQAVRKNGDPSLWVYCSHGSFEVSHVSHAAERSVFGMFLREGLRGAADLDGDRSIRMSELIGFTSANVAKWVDQATDRGATQSPKLFWGGGLTPRFDPKVIPQLGPHNDASLTVASLLQKPNANAAGFVAGGQSGKVRGLIQRNQFTLASHSRSKKSGGTDAKQEPSADASDAGSVQDEAAGDSADTGEKAGSASDGASEAKDEDASQDTAIALQLLANAWRTRDRIVANEPGLRADSDPILQQPHLWRELQGELVALEQFVSSGTAYPTSTVDDVLSGLFKNPDPETDTKSLVQSLFGQSTLRGKSTLNSIASKNIHSVGLTRVLAQIRGDQVLPDVEEAEKLLQQASSAPLEEWLKAKWNSDYDAMVELVLLKKLASREDLPWETIQLAVSAAFEGERVAALDLLSPKWARDEIQRADQQRFFAESLLMQPIGIASIEQVEALLRSARENYQNAERKLSDILLAERSLDLALANLSQYVRWSCGTRFVGDPSLEIHRSLLSLIGQIKTLSQHLDSPGKAHVSDVNAAREKLVDQQQQIETVCGTIAAARLLQHSPNPGDTAVADLLLGTSMVGSAVRTELLAGRSERDFALASTYRLARVGSDQVGTEAMITNNAQPGLAQWEALVRQAELSVQSIGLLQSDSLDAEAERVADAIVRTNAALDNLQQAFSSAKQDPSDPAARSELWEAHDGFRNSLKSCYRQSLAVSASANACAATTRSLRVVRRLLQIVDIRDAWQLATVDLATLSLPSRAKSSLLWQADRSEQRATYQSDDSSDPALEWSAHYRDASMQVCGQSSESVLSKVVQLDGPGVADLQYASTSDTRFTIQNLSYDDIEVTLSITYDRSLVEVDFSQHAVTSPSDEDTPDVRPDFFESLSVFDTLRSIPVRIAARQSVSVPCTFRRKPGASESSRFVLDVYRSSNLLASSAEAPVLLARQSTEVLLPVAELYVAHGKEFFVSGDQGLKLLPYPNRLQAYRFGVVSQGAKAKLVTLRCYALNEPWDASRANEIVERLEYAKPLTQMEIQIDKAGVPHFPAAPDAAEEKQPQEAPAKGSAEEKAGEEPAKEEAKEIKSIDLPHGLLVSLINSESGQVTLRPVQFSIQRPRRFVRPRVGFDFEKKQIRIDVSAIDSERIPAGSPVRVECRLATDEGGRTEGKLQGLITRSKPNASCFISVTTPPSTTNRVLIDVDGYPRSFMYDVPCGKQVDDLPEIIDERVLRMKTTADDGVLAATKTIPVSLEVDVPVGSFEDGNDQIHLGLDLEDSGIPDPDNSVRLSTDRSVAVGFVKALPNGQLELITAVTDHRVELPAEKLENLSIDVAAELTIDGVAKRFPSVELLIDTASPIVGSVNPESALGFVAVNSKILFNTWAWDEGSDVDEVIAAYDIDGSGEFPDSGQVFKALRVSDREWALTIDSGAEAGKKKLLVQAVDRVGNASDPASVEFEVYSLEQFETQAKLQTVDLYGVVRYRGAAAANVEMRLSEASEGDVAEDPSTASQEPGIAAKSSPDGNYVVSGVAPGKYVLEARAVIRNRVYRTQREVVVAVGPEKKMRVDISLP